MAKIFNDFLAGKFFNKNRKASRPKNETPSEAIPVVVPEPVPEPLPLESAKNGSEPVVKTGNGSTVIKGFYSHWCTVCYVKFQQLFLTCPNCGRDGTILPIPGDQQSLFVTSNESMVLSEENVKGALTTGYKTGEEEVDKVLGEALQGGSVILFGGKKGLGKSTLAMQIAQWLSKNPDIKNVLYYSTEEGLGQVKRLAQRIARGCSFDKIEINSGNTITGVIDKIASCYPKIIIIDSISSLKDPASDGKASGIKQVLSCAAPLITIARQTNLCLILIAHVSKAGDIAGPETLGHAVDAIMYIDLGGTSQHRYIRCLKNRYSATDEIGVLEMGEYGLSPSSIPVRRLTTDTMSEPGCASTVVFLNTDSHGGLTAVKKQIPRGIEIETDIMDASKPMFRMIENYVPRRTKILIRAVGASVPKTDKTKRGLEDVDFFVKVPIKIEYPSIELAIAVSIFSALYEIPVPNDIFFTGEIGPDGSIKETAGMEDRLKYAAQQGFKKVISGTDIPLDISQGLECFKFVKLSDLFSEMEEVNQKNENQKKEIAKLVCILKLLVDKRTVSEQPVGVPLGAAA